MGKWCTCTLNKAALEADIESHLSQELARNRRNGKSKKQ